MLKKIYFTVGPSQTYPTLPKHFVSALKEDIPSLNHRGAEFKKLYADTVSNLRNILAIPKTHQVFFVSSALEGMERTIQGVVEKNSFHLISGSFGASWMKIAEQLGKKTTSVILSEAKNINKISSKGTSFSEAAATSPSARNDVLVAVPKEAEVICITQNDTSTGIFIPEKEITELKKQNPDVLMAIDVVSSVPLLNLDFKYIDITFFSVQKGFGLPAGLGVMVVSPEALEKAERVMGKGVSIGSYHSLLNLSEKAKDNQTPETPNVLNIYLFNKVLKDMLKKGIGKIKKDTALKAKLFYDFFEKHKKYTPFVKNIDFRSPTTLVIDTPGESVKLRKKLAEKGFIVGAGYGDMKENQIRIANFPSHSIQDVRNLLKLI